MQPPTGLQHLSLTLDNLGTSSAKALAPALRALTKLQYLLLDMKWVDGAGATKLVPILQALTLDDVAGAECAALLAQSLKGQEH